VRPVHDDGRPGRRAATTHGRGQRRRQARRDEMHARDDGAWAVLLDAPRVQEEMGELDEGVHA